MSEEWKDIVDYIGIYLISNRGRVKRIAAGIGAVAGRILKPRFDSSGYIKVMLYKNGISIQRPVHCLVLETFIGPCLLEMECRHLDGNPKNNYLNNLEWNTRSKNQQDRVLHGTSNRGSRQGRSKLTEIDVIKIRRLLSEGSLTQLEISRIFGIAESSIHYIKTRETWKHV